MVAQASGAAEEDVLHLATSAAPVDARIALRRLRDVPSGLRVEEVDGGVLLARRAFPFERVQATVVALDGQTAVRVEQVERSATVGGLVAFSVLPLLVFVAAQCSPDVSHAVAGLVLLTAYQACVAQTIAAYDDAIEWVRRQVESADVALPESPYRAKGSAPAGAARHRKSAPWLLFATVATWVAVVAAPFPLRCPLALVMGAASMVAALRAFRPR